ncbi:MAG: MFS transporter [Defluviitaleaceae bacterium]|nr:MFS transporter [Defluviitaleaceae bacterium]
MLKLFKENKMFRVFLAYQAFSGLGQGMFQLFILLSVHLIYQNPIYTGIAGFLMAGPSILSFVIGPIVDRKNKVTIMRLTSVLEFLSVALLAFVPFQENFGVWFMFMVILIFSLSSLFEVPSSNALLPQIVHEDDIMRANSLVNIAALTGGIGIATLLFVSLRGGEVDFSLLFGFSSAFIAIAFIFSLFLRDSLAKKPQSPQKPPKNYLKDLKEGAKFLKQNILLYIVIAAVAKNFVIQIASVNTPMFAEYHVGADGYILLTLMGLIGGIAASYFVGIFGSRLKVGKLIFVLFAIAGMVRVVFALVLPHHYIGGLAVLVLYAALGGSLNIVFQSLRQKLPPKDMVGRIETISTTLSAVFLAIGALIGGFLGNALPVVDHIFIYQGIAYTVIGIIVILVPKIRKLPKMNDIQKED